MARTKYCVNYKRASPAGLYENFAFSNSRKESEKIAQGLRMLKGVIEVTITEVIEVKTSKKYQCPECGAPLTAWADLDARVTCEVSPTGRLKNRRIENNFQTDGRAGVECSQCKWAADSDDDQLMTLAERAFAIQSDINYLSAKRER